MNLVITGTSRGIGKYLAEYYASKEFSVFGCSRGQGPQLPDYTHYTVDVTNMDSLLRFVSDIKRDTGGRIYALINNAGISSMNHSLLTPHETVRKIMDTNFLASFFLSKELAKLMKTGGRIINFSSVAFPMDLEGELAYSASKAAVVSMTKIMAKEFAHLGITVNAVGPNPIKTDLVRGVPQEKLDGILNRQAIKRFGTFKDVSNITDFFLMDESDFITGQTIYLGGVS